MSDDQISTHLSPNPSTTMRATLPASSRALAPRAAPRAPVCRVGAVPRDRALPARLPRAPTTPLPLSRLPTCPRRALLPPRAGGGDTDVPIIERFAAATYIFPLFDSIRFARFLFLAYPATRAVLIPLNPWRPCTSPCRWPRWSCFLACTWALCGMPMRPGL